MPKAHQPPPSSPLVPLAVVVALVMGIVGAGVTARFSGDRERAPRPTPPPPPPPTTAAEDAVIEANEEAALATLRAIAFAQAQVRAAGAVDTDADRKGEFAFLSELAATAPLRVAGTGGLPTPGGEVLQPALLAPEFGDLLAGPTGGAVERRGYLFQVYLPGMPDEDGAFPGLSDPSTAMAVSGPGVGTFTDPEGCEELWCAYAWPAQARSTGQRVFFVNQQGTLLETANEGGLYDGLERGPAFDAALSRARAKDMRSPAAEAGSTGNDGQEWRPIGG